MSIIKFSLYLYPTVKGTADPEILVEPEAEAHNSLGSDIGLDKYCYFLWVSLYFSSPSLQSALSLLQIWLSSFLCYLIFLDSLPHSTLPSHLAPPHFPQ